MGRTEKSQGLAPPSIRREIRAKQARHIINKTIPAILTSNGRARRGAEGSELIVDPKSAGIASINSGENRAPVAEDAQYTTRKSQRRRKIKSNVGLDDEPVIREGHEDPSLSKRKGQAHTVSPSAALPAATPPQESPPSSNRARTIRIIATDTLTAAHMLTHRSHYPTAPTTAFSKTPAKPRNICILNMASPLRPGGGVLSGATSQEEFLCARTTLLPSLKDAFYRLPECGGIWTSDVLVFRSALSLSDSKGELGASDRYWVNVVSAGMLRFPELEDSGDGVGKLSRRDREAVEAKMRAVLRIVVGKGVRRVVLGAWGCGAYGNPVEDVAAAWKKVLDGGSRGGGWKGKGGKEEGKIWEGLEEVVFAITNRKMAEEFALAFGDGLEVETGPGDVRDEEDEEEDGVTEELRTKIREMESQVGKVWNPELKARMSVILDGLKAQLREREGEAGNAQSEEGESNNQIKSAKGEGGAGESSDDEEQDSDEGGVVLER